MGYHGYLSDLAVTLRKINKKLMTFEDCDFEEVVFYLQERKHYKVFDLQYIDKEFSLTILSFNFVKDEYQTFYMHYKNKHLYFRMVFVDKLFYDSFEHRKCPVSILGFCGFKGSDIVSIELAFDFGVPEFRQISWFQSLINFTSLRLCPNTGYISEEFNVLFFKYTLHYKCFTPIQDFLNLIINEEVFHTTICTNVTMKCRNKEYKASLYVVEYNDLYFFIDVRHTNFICKIYVESFKNFKDFFKKENSLTYYSSIMGGDYNHIVTLNVMLY